MAMLRIIYEVVQLGFFIYDKMLICRKMSATKCCKHAFRGNRIQPPERCTALQLMQGHNQQKFGDTLISKRIAHNTNSLNLNVAIAPSIHCHLLIFRDGSIINLCEMKFSSFSYSSHSFLSCQICIPCDSPECLSREIPASTSKI